MGRINFEKLEQEIREFVKEVGNTREDLIPLLKRVQQRYGYIPEEAMRLLGKILGIPPVEIYGVVSFYSFLYDKPMGKFVIKLCGTISCRLAGGEKILKQLENELGIKPGESTSDGIFSLEKVNCIGLCDQSPCMLVNDQPFVKLTPQKVHTIINACKKVVSTSTEVYFPTGSESVVCK